ncbi:hypothetical protein [Hymenobacter glacieicola]|nr:hypothetical protein [Hymenobacter glacieicola]
MPRSNAPALDLAQRVATYYLECRNVSLAQDAQLHRVCQEAIQAYPFLDMQALLEIAIDRVE